MLDQGHSFFVLLDAILQGYLALLYFADNVLNLSSRRYLLDDDYARIVERLEQQLLREEVELQAVKESLHRMEEEVLKRMWRLGHGEVAG